MTTPAYNYVTPNVLASGKAWADLLAGGLTARVEALITSNTANSAAPTVAPTATATGGGATGGSLAAGTYYIVITETDGVGETTVSPESLQLTVSATNIPRVTFPTLKSGNTARNIYLTAANGASGTETLYATGITAATYDLAAAAPTTGAVSPPTANSTGLFDGDLSRIRAGEAGNLQYEYQTAATAIDNFTSGKPVLVTDTLRLLGDVAMALKTMLAAIEESAVHIAANPGSMTIKMNPIGQDYTVRTWP